MATSLITTSATWTGKQTTDIFLKPMFIDDIPFQAMGIRVIPNVQSALKLNYFSEGNKFTKAYSRGFSGSTGETFTQRTLTVARMKAEMAQAGEEFYQTVLEQALNKGYASNDLTGTVLEGIVLQLFRNAVAQDLFRQYWLGDTYKTTVSSGKYTGTADTDYNAYDGMWRLLMADAATSPSATQIYRKEVADGGIAQVATITVSAVTSALSGNLVIRWNGTNYSQAERVNAATTIDDWYATHAATFARHGITITETNSTIVMTATKAGMPFNAPTIPSANSGTASVAATTATAAQSALANDEAIGYLRDLWENSFVELKGLPINQKVFLVTHSIYDNYLESLEDSGTYTETAKDILINGKPQLYYRGIPVIPMDWGSYLSADFPTGYYSNRIIYTAKDNLVIGTDLANDLNKIEMWYNQDEQENRLRAMYRVGAQYVHNKLVSVAY